LARQAAAERRAEEATAQAPKKSAAPLHSRTDLDDWAGAAGKNDFSRVAFQNQTPASFVPQPRKPHGEEEYGEEE